MQSTIIAIVLFPLYLNDLQYFRWKRVEEKEHSIILTLPMLKLFSSKAQGRKYIVFKIHLIPVILGIYLIALSKHPQMSIQLPGLLGFLSGS